MTKRTTEIGWIANQLRGKSHKIVVSLRLLPAPVNGTEVEVAFTANIENNEATLHNVLERNLPVTPRHRRMQLLNTLMEARG